MNQLNKNFIVKNFFIQNQKGTKRTTVFIQPLQKNVQFLLKTLFRTRNKGL